ncbi:hypothetical protein [Cupriavidus metallidurans]|jgi:hypothetical protein|uniref:hypothetical protein n=1 Tax=Cupriavidus metallidurans TaxID=119219 RepID=UPI0007898F90|nr:hypothetical protein [Cupriavidus metallidurans]
MLTVRNLALEPTLLDWLHDNARLLAALTVWAAALLWLAGTGPRLVESAWYTVSFVEGGLIYDRMPDEATCQARVVDDTAACLSGAQLGGSQPSN